MEWGDLPCSRVYPENTGFRWWYGTGGFVCPMHDTFSCPLFEQTETPGTITAERLSTWMHFVTMDNPPNIQVIPRKLGYIRIFFREWCYIQTIRHGEVKRTLKKMAYTPL
jgi:hypothetical protein